MAKQNNYFTVRSQPTWTDWNMWFRTFVVLVACLFSTSALAQTASEKLARKLQDPLANLRVLNTENNFDFAGGKYLNTVSEIQPVYAISLEKLNIVLRAVITVAGLSPEAQKPIVGNQLPPGESDIWGLSDSKFMAFFSLKSESRFKWGVGPLITLPTATDTRLNGPGWGGGPALILVGSIGSQWTYAAIGTHIFGRDKFSTSTLQPMLFYNVPGGDGLAINYNAVSSYNHNTTKGNEWTVPLGLSVSKPWVFESGHAFDASIGFYANVVKPEGGADWTFRFTAGIVFP